MSIDITLDDAKLSRLVSELPQRLGQQIRASGLRIEAGARRRAPSKSGRLRRSIAYSKPENFAADVDVGEPYAAAVEFGTVDAPAQPFLTPAVEEERPRLDANLAALFRSLGAEPGGGA